MEVWIEMEILLFQICVSQKGSGGMDKSPKENKIYTKEELKEGIQEGILVEMMQG